MSAALCATALGCFTPGAQRPDAAELVAFSVEPPGAEIWVDDAYRGRVDRWRDGAIPLEPGRRRVELRARAHIARRLELEVRPGEEMRVEVRLTPDPDALWDE